MIWKCWNGFSARTLAVLTVICRGFLSPYRQVPGGASNRPVQLPSASSPIHYLSVFRCCMISTLKAPLSEPRQWNNELEWMRLTYFSVISYCLSGSTEKNRNQDNRCRGRYWDGRLPNTSQKCYCLNRLPRFLLNVYLMTLFTYIDLLTLHGRMTANKELGKRLSWPMLK
jgi:hypothetical protein